jgi:hypothetical protein
VRSAMIAVSVMLAIFLAWPLVFGHGGAPVDAAPVEARAVHAAAASAELALVDGSPKRAPLAASRKPESCYHRYQREVAACSIKSAACRLSVADQWDLCEATGFWPQ